MNTRKFTVRIGSKNPDLHERYRDASNASFTGDVLAALRDGHAPTGLPADAVSVIATAVEFLDDATLLYEPNLPAAVKTFLDRCVGTKNRLKKLLESHGGVD